MMASTGDHGASGSLLFLLDGIVLRSSQLGADSEIGSQQRTWGERSQIATRDQIATRTICCITVSPPSLHRGVLTVADEHLALMAPDKSAAPFSTDAVDASSSLHRYIAKAADAFTVSTAAGKPPSPLRSRHLAIGGGPSAALLHCSRAKVTAPGRFSTPRLRGVPNRNQALKVTTCSLGLQSLPPDDPLSNIKTPPGNSIASTQRSHLSILQRFNLLTTFFCSFFGLNRVGLASETLAILAFWHGRLVVTARQAILGKGGQTQLRTLTLETPEPRHAMPYMSYWALTAWAMSAVTEPYESTCSQRQTCKTCALVTAQVGGAIVLVKVSADSNSTLMECQVGYSTEASPSCRRLTFTLPQSWQATFTLPIFLFACYARRCLAANASRPPRHHGAATHVVSAEQSITAHRPTSYCPAPGVASCVPFPGLLCNYLPISSSLASPKRPL
ncbi:uncharacterized protein MYCFIDRAFT_180414 [Pseudocercospora fijiensis CIRAD86]|uniref:Uncharacterized protein n=1 Tax=Pseudocercospora fijiensis (strain CIRAD86) TaxID=383855 RepID=M2ZY88_PSEFD|nr:uncharacterized protein MYCFIDRAFT_180414 [Pseudocercospora fijiensis CIRAD86]EME77081.1 hypothetical protein MYCFIDRAFT_180414 [Pseudocercospora fijiensis CIRAD86]